MHQGRDRLVSIANSALLTISIFVIFLVPLFPHPSHRLLYSVGYTAIFIAAVLSMEDRSRLILWFAVVATAAEWISHSLHFEPLLSICRTSIALFFVYVFSRLIGQVIRTRKVTPRVIMESISSYFLLGLIFAIIITVTSVYHPGSFSFPPESAVPDGFSAYSDHIYFTFVTLTTLGYGDIAPLTPVAKSLANLVAISGQIYLAVIIATLVGKATNTRTPEASPDDS